MARDIDYAAIAVENAIAEKYARHADLSQLTVTPGERTISIHDGSREISGTRDDLLATIRAAESYADLWQAAADSPKPR